MKGRKSSKEQPSLLEDQQQIIEKIGKRIKGLRLKKGYDSAELFAYENDLDRAQYARFEKGVNVQISTLVRLLRVFEISIGEFFGEGFD